MISLDLLPVNSINSAHHILIIASTLTDLFFVSKKSNITFYEQTSTTCLCKLDPIFYCTNLKFTIFHSVLDILILKTLILIFNRNICPKLIGTIFIKFLLFNSQFSNVTYNIFFIELSY